MGKKNILQGIVVLLCIGFLAYSVFNYRYQKKLERDDLELQRNNIGLNAVIDQLRFNEELVYKAQSIIFNNNLVLIDDKNNLFNLTDFTVKDKIIYRVRQSDCSACYEAEFNNMRKWLSRKVIENDLLVITSFNSKREVNAFKMAFASEFNIFNLHKGKLPDAVEKIASPYYFVTTNKNPHLSMVFVPEKAIASLSEGYLAALNNRFESLSKAN